MSGGTGPGDGVPADGVTVRRTVLPGGLRVITESLPAVRSVALGIWVGVGSRDEDVRHAGATHYLEHLLFKGTKRRTALEISAEMDAVGGEMNAFTTKEYTCYYARVLDADLPLAADVLSDMVTNSLITPQDVDAERNVVLEEIAMNEDDPTDTVHEAFAAHLFGDTPLGRPVLGTVESINTITRDQIDEHYRAKYGPERLVVAAAGSLDHDDLVEQVRQSFGPVLQGEAEPAPPRLSGEYAQPGRGPGSGLRLISRGIEQANLVLGCEGLSRNDGRRYALGVLNAALGGGMSSRLFQEIREKRGLAYSVYSFASQHADTGMWGIYVGCLPSKADDVLSICTSEVEKLVSGGLTDAELERGKGQMRGSIVLGLEDPSSRMSRRASPSWSTRGWSRSTRRSRRSRPLRTTTSVRSPPRSSAAPRPWPSSARSTTVTPSPAPSANANSKIGVAFPQHAAEKRRRSCNTASPGRE